MRYYHVCLSDGSQYGPYDEESLQNMVANGQIPANCNVWTEGMATWLPYSQVFTAPALPPVPPAAPALPPVPSAAPAPPAQKDEQYVRAGVWDYLAAIVLIFFVIALCVGDGHIDGKKGAAIIFCIGMGIRGIYRIINTFSGGKLK